MSSNLTSAASQKLSKLEFSDSFTSEDSNLINTSTEDFSLMIDTLHSTLVHSKVLPKSSQKPEATFTNLTNLITTICDEFLLEIDKPLSKTHCSVDTISSVFLEDPSKLSSSPADSRDVLSKIFDSHGDVTLTEKNCEELCSMIVGLSRDSQSFKFKKIVDELEEKVVLYGEESIKAKKLLRAKEKEIEMLKKNLEAIQAEFASQMKGKDEFATPALSISTDFS